MLLYFLFSFAATLGAFWAGTRLRWRDRRVAAEVQQYVERLSKEEEGSEPVVRRLTELDRAKSRVVAAIVGEMRNPLMLLLGPLKNWAESTAALPPEQRLQARTLLRNVGQLKNFVDQLSEILHLELETPRLRPSRSDLVALLEHLVLSCEGLAERQGVTLRFTVSVEEVSFAFDREKVWMAFHGLLCRAIDATPEGGGVDVRVSLCRRNSTGSSVCVEVKDEGGIMTEDDLRLLQEDAHWASQVAPHRAAAGISLALARGFITLHGGHIRAEGDEGRLEVTLPLRQEVPGFDLVEERGDSVPAAELMLAAGTTSEPYALRVLSHDEEPETSETTTILVVDDHPGIRGYLCYALRKHHRVIEAADGEAALALVREHQPDLVISDIVMPVLDGHGLCRAIKQDDSLSHIPVILVSAQDGDAVKKQGFESGADDYMTKPFDLEEAILRIDNLIRVRRQLRQRFSREALIRPSEINVSSADDVFLRRVREVVEKNMSDAGFGVQELASELGISPRQLQRKLRELVDQSPVEFIRTLRLQRASQLLDGQAGTISEVAYSVGFTSLSYFAKCFRELFGQPPSEFAASRA